MAQLIENVCKYTKIHQDGYGATWETQCKNKVQCSSPIDVGMSFTPLPNQYGKYCRYCGNVINLK